MMVGLEGKERGEKERKGEMRIGERRVESNTDEEGERR